MQTASLLTLLDSFDAGSQRGDFLAKIAHLVRQVRRVGFLRRAFADEAAATRNSCHPASLDKQSNCPLHRGEVVAGLLDQFPL